MEALFDDLEDVVFFIKDEEGRYVIVNRTLATRCGFSRKRDVVGRTTDEVYPPPFGAQYREQDRLVLETDTPIKDKLELQLYVEGAPGWCLTNKVPIHGEDGSVVGTSPRRLNLSTGPILGTRFQRSLSNAPRRQAARCLVWPIFHSVVSQA